jgi:hydrogenase maturation protease
MKRNEPESASFFMAEAERATALAEHQPAKPPGGSGLPVKRALVLGLGNDLLCDDAVGLRAVQTLKPWLAGADDVDIVESCEMGLALLDFMVGYRQLVVVDAVQTGRAPPGFIHELGLEDLKRLPQMSPHFLGLGEILALGRLLGLTVPEQVRVFAVEAGDPFTLSLQMTAPVEQALPAVTDRILATLRSWGTAGLPFKPAASEPGMGMASRG